MTTIWIRFRDLSHSIWFADDFDKIFGNALCLDLFGAAQIPRIDSFGLHAMAFLAIQVLFDLLNARALSTLPIFVLGRYFGKSDGRHCRQYRQTLHKIERVFVIYSRYGLVFCKQRVCRNFLHPGNEGTPRNV